MGNDLLDAFTSRLKNRYSIDSENMTISEWLEKNTTLRKKPFSLKGYEFQRAIADDMHENMSVIKPSQVGLTEIQVRKVLAWARRNDGVGVIYTMPNDEMRSRVSQTRIKPIIDNDKVFNSEFDAEGVRQKGLIQLGQSFVYLTGAKEGDATSIPADFVANDEIDLTNEEMLKLFRSRLQGSKYKINQKFSTPTYPKAGVNKDYVDSDQMELFCKCPACNHQQIPDFTRQFCEIPGLGDAHESLVDEITIDSLETIDLRNSFIKCEKCGAPLDVGAFEHREWVPRYPSRSEISRGYRIRPFTASNLDIRYLVRELLEYKKLGQLRRFYNTVLGEAYIDDSIALNDDMIRVALQPGTFTYNGQPCFMGVDMGLMCHLVLGIYSAMDGWLIFRWEVVPATQIVAKIKELVETYNVVGGAVDRFPYTPTAIEIRATTKGKVVPVEYRGPTELTVRENELTPEETYAQVNKTSTLDEVAKFIRGKQMRFINYGDKAPTIMKQLTDNVRHEEADVKPVWKKQTGDDHFFHALAFMISGKRLADYILFNTITEERTMVLTSNVDIKSPGSHNLFAANNRPRQREIGFGG